MSRVTDIGVGQDCFRSRTAKLRYVWSLFIEYSLFLVIRMQVCPVWMTDWFPHNAGWDPIFEYEGKTYAEMDKEEKVSETGNSF